MPSLANLSMRGVGMVPPYTPKFPQPTLSTRMNTMLGFFAWALALGAPAIPIRAATVANARLIFPSHFMGCPLLVLLVEKFTTAGRRPRGTDAGSRLFEG